MGPYCQVNFGPYWQVNCRAVIVRSSKFGDGAFAARDIKQGECIEWGIVRRLPPGFDGNAAEYVFTWSDDRTVWAITSGTAAFLNTAAHGKANTKVCLNIKILAYMSYILFGIICNT